MTLKAESGRQLLCVNSYLSGTSLSGRRVARAASAPFDVASNSCCFFFFLFSFDKRLKIERKGNRSEEPVRRHNGEFGGRGGVVGSVGRAPA